MLDRFLVTRRLVKRDPHGRGACLPLRAYGKLELATEYVEVGCDDTRAGQEFRQWVRDGSKQLAAASPNGALQIRDHRLLLSLDHGRVWAIACVWHSQDKPTEHGSLRVFPFSLFVLVPAPPRGRAAATLAARCTPLWEYLASAYPPLCNAPTRAACADQVRAQCVEYPSDVTVIAERLRTNAERIALSEWITAVLPHAPDADELWARLLGRLEEHWNASTPSGWRLPCAPPLGAAEQLAAWFGWLERNLGRRATLGAVFVPDALETATLCELRVLPRAVRPGDFAALSADAAHLEAILGSPLASRRRASVDPAHLHALLPTLCSGNATLADLARCTFPQPRLAGR